MGDTAAASQFIEADIRALAGNDSIAVTGSFVSTTVRAGTGNDTLDIEGRTNAGSSATAFYAGAGADSLEIQGNTVTVYGGPALMTPLMALTLFMSAPLFPQLFTVQAAPTASNWLPRFKILESKVVLVLRLCSVLVHWMQPPSWVVRLLTV